MDPLGFLCGRRFWAVSRRVRGYNFHRSKDGNKAKRYRSRAARTCLKLRRRRNQSSGSQGIITTHYNALKNHEHFLVFLIRDAFVRPRILPGWRRGLHSCRLGSGQRVLRHLKQNWAFVVYFWGSTHVIKILKKCCNKHVANILEQAELDFSKKLQCSFLKNIQHYESIDGACSRTAY